jgi:hypothetical protein
MRATHPASLQAGAATRQAASLSYQMEAGRSAQFGGLRGTTERGNRMSHTADLDRLIVAGNADLDVWLSKVMACARRHSVDFALQAVTRAVLPGDKLRTCHIYHRLRLQYAAMVTVSQERTSSFDPTTLLAIRQAERQFDDRAELASRLLQAFRAGLA